MQYFSLLKKLIPAGKWRTPIILLILFLIFLALPFIFGSDKPFQDMKRMVTVETKENLDKLKPNELARPGDFSPIITDGPLAITQVDADRGSWSWSQAKRLSSDIWQGASAGTDFNSFYCGCDISKSGSTGGKVDLASCGVVPRKSSNRAKRLEWEHIVPASIIGQGNTCWTQGAPQCRDRSGKSFKGRSCCEIADPNYNMAATDPVNLVPAVGEINGDRSNFSFGIITGEPRNYGVCDMEIDPSQRLAEPPADKRGDIARIWAYMSRSYGIPVSPEEAKTYRDWMIEDPVSQQEILINQRILQSGHRSNPFVLEATPTQVTP